jgi:hypothetical protein
MPLDPKAWLDEIDASYARLHTAKEDAFWTARMGLADDAELAQRELDRREIALQRFLQDPERLKAARAALAAAFEGEDLIRATGWVRTFECHAIESPAARALAEEITEEEGRLERERGEMALGYADPERGFVRASSVKLAQILRSEGDRRVRRAAWDGLRSIERFVLERGFLELVKKRNRLGRMLGAEDYYDWKTRRVEGMAKADVFALLDELEERTRAAGERAVRELAERHGAAAETPWSVLFLSTGDVTREQDAYFPFRAALERWGRSFAALGIRYAGATLVLDLVDRRGKYENGFMHGPVVAWRRGGERTRARIQFTANAIPGMVGSGFRALQTLFHEGGHAAHFANVDMPSPCFAQEFAPTSVAFSETQSMFCDSLLDDADWQSRYALDAAGRAMPPELIAKGVRAHQPFAAWQARAMLAVCYGEKALYEIPERELTPERALAELRDVERRMLFLADGAPRPTLAVPHLLAGDSSAYYHGYVLAEMAVHQTREHFLARDGRLTDNPRVGPELRDVYWRAGNSRTFAEFVERMTRRPLSAEAYARRVNRTADEAVARASESIARLAPVPRFDGEIDLDAAIRVVHGRETVAELAGGFARLSDDFARWIDGLAAAER